MTQATRYSAEQIKELAEATAGWRGWDLLRLNIRKAPTPWQLEDVSRELLTGKESVLDMGCGDGRVLASLADRYRRGIGVDVSKSRVDRARLSLPMKLRMRVHFTRASAHAVPAPGGTFHLVINRHAPLFPEEVDRVLAPGGVFMTQQVGNQDSRAVYATFGLERAYSPPAEVMLPGTLNVLTEFDYRLLRHEAYDVPMVFGDIPSLLFWMQSVPVPHDFDAEQDAATVLEIIDRLGTPNGIVTNEHRELLVMQKPE